MHLLCKARVVLGFLFVKSHVLKNQDLQSRAHEAEALLMFAAECSAARDCYLAILQCLCLLLDLVAYAVIGFLDLHYSRRYIDATTRIHG